MYQFFLNQTYYYSKVIRHSEDFSWQIFENSSSYDYLNRFTEITNLATGRNLKKNNNCILKTKY